PASCPSQRTNDLRELGHDRPLGEMTNYLARGLVNAINFHAAAPVGAGQSAHTPRPVCQYADSLVSIRGVATGCPTASSSTSEISRVSARQAPQRGWPWRNSWGPNGTRQPRPN